MTIPQLKNFLIIADTLNFHRAAEQILLAQPALSRQVQQMEEEIGANLFNRDRRNVTLTEGGKFFRVETERILFQLEKAMQRTREIERGEAGEFRIGHASSTMQSILPNFLKNIRATLPNLKTFLIEETNRSQIELLRQRRLDVSFMPNVFIPEDLDSRLIYKENFALILPANHPLCLDDVENGSGHVFDFSRLKNESFILPPREEGIGYIESLEKVFQSFGFSPHIEYESPNAASVLRLVEAGLGISLMSKSTLRGINLNIKAVELTDFPLKVEMRLIWLRERGAELKTFFDLVDRFL